MLFGSGLDFLLANKNGWLPLLDSSARGLDFGTLLPDNRSIFGADADKFGQRPLGIGLRLLELPQARIAGSLADNERNQIADASEAVGRDRRRHGRLHGVLIAFAAHAHRLWS
jgi:hypothetical protein